MTGAPNFQGGDEKFIHYFIQVILMQENTWVPRWFTQIFTQINIKKEIGREIADWVSADQDWM
jgi:hypothetical protein